MSYRFGFATGYSPEMNIREMAGWVREAERMNYEIAFFSETLNIVRDAISSLAAFSMSTSRIRLGATQIVRLRSPVVLAQTIASLDELSNGRITIALGACTRLHALRHSVEPRDPLVTLTEYFAAVKKLVTGKLVDYHGQVLNLDGAGISFEPQRREPPIWIAATSRTGLRLAGQIADGVLLNSVASPAYAVNAIRHIETAAAEVGRNLKDFEIAQIVVASVSTSREEALEAVRWEVARKFTPPQIPHNARKRLAVGEPYIREGDLPVFKAEYEKGGMDALMKAIPDDYLSGLTASGTSGEVEDKMKEYRKAGVRLVFIRPAISKMTKELLETFSPGTK